MNSDHEVFGKKKAIAVVINPCAGAGRGEKVSEFISNALLERLTPAGVRWKVFHTEKSGDGIGLASKAIADGFNMIVSVGGDGTHNEVINGISEYYALQDVDQQESEVVMALIPVGTGGDFQRSLGLTSFTLEQYVEMIIKPSSCGAVPQQIDVGFVEATPVESKLSNKNVSEPEVNSRYYLNISSCGLSAAVCNGANNSSKKFGGFLTFFYQTCLQTLLWNNKPVRWQLDDNEEWHTARIYQLVMANGQYYGGGMRVAPLALINDGKFDVLAFKDVGVLDIAMLKKIYTGSHMEDKKVVAQHGAKVRVELDDPEHVVLIEADGEIVGKLPATWTNIPKAVWLLYPPLMNANPIEYINSK